MSEEKNENLNEDEAETLTKNARIKLCFFSIIALAAIAVLATMIIIFIKKGKEEPVEIPENGKKGEENNPTENTVDIKGTYAINIAAEDYGCRVNRAVISLDHVIDGVNLDSFIVTETKYAASVDIPSTLGRKIEKVFLSDEKGEEVSDASKYVTIDLYYSPSEGSPIISQGSYNIWSKVYYLTIKKSEKADLTSEGVKVGALNIETKYTNRTSPADAFKKDKKQYAGITYNYAVYNPENKSKNLFVWLNGAGEGGSAVYPYDTDVEVTLLANKVTALAGEKIQKKLGGCNVLVPQAPTMWMMDDQGHISGPRESHYLESLVDLIDDYVKNNEIENVFIGGCSNGGYMTMNIAMDYGNKYQGYVPICEAMRDDLITDEDINTLKDVPIYFVYSKDDNAVNPEYFEEPTIDRLRNVTATDLHVSTTEHVVDTSGKVKGKDGKPYQYMGHFSWIYFFNDETKCEEEEKSAFDWIKELIDGTK